MIKKILLIFSFITLITITFSGTTYAANTLAVGEELSKLNELYKEGVITEEEFKKAKSILLDSDSNILKKKKKTSLFGGDGIFKKEKLTAVERRRLEEELIEAEIALKEQLRAEQKAERARIKEARLDEKKRIAEEREKACADDPKSKECRTAKKLLTKILAEIRNKSSEEIKQDKEERVLEKQAAEERKKRIAKQKELEKQASLEEKAKNKAEKAARKAERKRLKAEWKKACSDDPESKACKEGKPSEKIKNVLKKIEKKLGG